MNGNNHDCDDGKNGGKMVIGKRCILLNENNGDTTKDQRSTEKMIWKQVTSVNGNMKKLLQLKHDGKNDGDDDKQSKNVDQDEQEETRNDDEEKVCSSYNMISSEFLSESRNSISSSTMSTMSTSSSSTPTLIKYRKLSQRPKDQPPPP